MKLYQLKETSGKDFLANLMNQLYSNSYDSDDFRDDDDIDDDIDNDIDNDFNDEEKFGEIHGSELIYNNGSIEHPELVFSLGDVDSGEMKKLNTYLQDENFKEDVDFTWEITMDDIQPHAIVISNIKILDSSNFRSWITFRLGPYRYE